MLQRDACVNCQADSEAASDVEKHSVCFDQNDQIGPTSVAKGRDPGVAKPPLYGTGLTVSELDWTVACLDLSLVACGEPTECLLLLFADCALPSYCPYPGGDLNPWGLAPPSALTAPWP